MPFFARVVFLIMLQGLLTSGAARAQQPSAAADGEAAATALTPLDDYTSRTDPSTQWELERRVELPTHAELHVRLTSQTWRTADEVDRPVWRHALVIAVPTGCEAETALLFVTGGSERADDPGPMDERLRGIALATRSVVAELRCVPNQPLRLLTSDHPQRERYEDDLLAGSWIECMETGDPTWLAQLPMAKSAVEAMTAVQECLAQQPQGEAPAIERFTVSGASKRGWTSWLAAAVDDRVAAVAPIVIDVLNIAPSMEHHHASYGFWSEALGDYESHGLADRLDSPDSAAIRAIVDPYAYRDRYTMPKCLINASGDEFFLPDSSRFYFDDLPGEKHLSYTPNCGHSLAGSNALDALVAFHASVVHGLQRPTVSWTGGDDAAEHTVTCTARPTEAVLWRAVNPRARDFRYPVVGAAYKPTRLEPAADGAYHVSVTAPESGYSATFVRFAFDIGAAKPFRVSTPVWVAPDVEPFAERE
ncbi:PhoPQ-activated pathogenicity-related protein [Pseudobythopirellula maris]|uniref:PhoPQ-activated pathogenicity-related protein n=1 Tax=Pseudobythopirellula maris TaxID=2527991 RepID=A0A5C5ZJS7_9BACT|nr:PhoPQ-activated protein PqaA family protein [Pseudobythopirellula maris]TWT87460.1 PhoPQ-activated pathogenicity-related protein [Pseudobythopirellula maris]